MTRCAALKLGRVVDMRHDRFGAHALLHGEVALQACVEDYHLKSLKSAPMQSPALRLGSDFAHQVSTLICEHSRRHRVLIFQEFLR